MYVTPDLYNWTLYFIFKFVYFSGKGLESNISKEVLPLNQPFSPLSSPLKKKEEETNFSSELFYGPSFSTKEQKLENLHVMKKNKKETLSLICPALSSQVWKKSRTEVQQRANKKEKSGHPPSPPKKSTSLAFFLSERKKIITLCKNGSFRWRIYGLP